jgi:hypothetical protein
MGIETKWRSGQEAQDEMERLRQEEQADQVLKQAQVGWPRSGPQPGPHRWLRPVTPTKATVTLRADTFERPVVIEFINAKDEQSLIQFVHKYGLPGSPNLDRTEGAPLNYVVRCRQALDLVLNLHHAGLKSRAVAVYEVLATSDWVSTIVPRLTIPIYDDTPQLTLRPNTLLAYMLLEAGMIMSGNIRLMRCEHCGKVFASGAGGGKRRTAMYCSNRCRVAEQRAQARTIEADQKAKLERSRDQDVTTAR